MGAGTALVITILAAGGALSQNNPDLLNKVLRRLDLIDLDSLLSNRRILTSYVKCLLHTGNCSPEARDFRRITPQVMRNLCGNCEERHKEHFRHIYRTVRKNYPSFWEKLIDYYDPNMKYRNRLVAFLEEKPKT